MQQAMIGELKGLSKDFDGRQIISVAVQADFREEYDDLKDGKVTVVIKKYRKGRSLDANAMAWSLINKIAAKLQEKEPRHGWTPEEVYRTAIKDVAGACSVHCVPDDQLQQFIEDWQSLGIGFQVETFPSRIEGCTNAKFWKGSHLYDTQQMSTLINILIQEAEQQGIATITDEEVQKKLEGWQKAYDKKHSSE